MKKIKVMCVFGTRPEGIKMAPVVKELSFRNNIDPIVVITAQHREMLDQVMDLFNLIADEDLNIMHPNQTLSDITIRALGGLEQVIIKHKPDILLVQGDTSTAFVAALAAFYHKIPVGHIEAGLRTDNRYNPFPEEMNRRLISSIAELHFPPTDESFENLLKCGVDKDSIYLTGNTVIDALLAIAAESDAELPEKLQTEHTPGTKMIFVETHRRENLGEPMENICRALKRITIEFPDTEIVFSVHKNPRVRETVYSYLADTERVILLEPVDYPVMIKLMQNSYFIMTDSGGLQEEAPSLGKPVLVLRENTERPEGIRAGTARLIGTDEEKVFSEARHLLTDETAYENMSKAVNPYGDGTAAKRIADALLYFSGIEKTRPLPFDLAKSKK